MNHFDELMQKCQEQEAAIRELEARLELQPCGHPRFCIRVGEKKAPGQFVHVCGWCESLEVIIGLREGLRPFAQRYERIIAQGDNPRQVLVPFAWLAYAASIREATDES